MGDAGPHSSRRDLEVGGRLGCLHQLGGARPGAGKLPPYVGTCLTASTQAVVLAFAVVFMGSAASLAGEEGRVLRNVSLVETLEGRKVVAASAGRVEVRNVALGPFMLGPIKTAVLDDLRVDIFSDRLPDIKWVRGGPAPKGPAVRMEVGAEKPVVLELRRAERDLYAALERAWGQLVRDATWTQGVVRFALNGLRARLYVDSQLWASLSCGRGSYAAQKNVLECHDATLTSRGRGGDLKAPLIRFVPGRKTVAAGVEGRPDAEP